MASATFAALMPAPPTQTRPWTRVPSIVKKRRVRVLDRRWSSAPSVGDLGEPVEQRARAAPARSSNQSRPLSTPLSPILGPQSSIRTPASGSPSVADRDDERVHAVPLAADLELGEDDGQLGVGGGVADVVLAGPGRRAW